MDSFGSFFGGFIVSLVIGLIGTTMVVESNRDYYWNEAYCTALGGEIVSGDICVKNNQIVEIPPRS
jgi:hypothetical protein